MEEMDVDEGLFTVRSVDEATAILLPQTPEKLRELVRLSFYRPAKFLPSCFLTDFIDGKEDEVCTIQSNPRVQESFGPFYDQLHEVMCTEYLQERKELIQALHKDRKLSNLPKITQIKIRYSHWNWHLGENAQLVTIENAGHAINVEKSKEMFKHLKSFLVDPLPPKLEMATTASQTKED
ncbi:unnamed protein product [Camellia sinensis]